MNDFQFITLIIAALTGLGGLAVSLYNLRLNSSNRKNFMRERVYNYQFDFFVKLNKYTADIEFSLGEINQPDTNLSDAINKFNKAVDDLDYYTASNDITIPEIVYYPLDEYVKFLIKISARISNDPSYLTKKVWDEFIYHDTNVHSLIIEHLKLEELGIDNKNLVKSRRIERYE